MAGFSTIRRKWAGGFSLRDRSMAGASPDDTEHLPSSTVSITVLSVKPVKFGKIFALASVEIDIDGVVLVLHEVRATRVQPMGTQIDLPMFATKPVFGAARSPYLTRFAGNWQGSARQTRRAWFGG
jgi:hypothetical protein